MKKLIATRPESSEEGLLSDEEARRLRSHLEQLLVDYGGQHVLGELGDVLQHIESAGNAVYVGKAIEALAEVEW